ncbi:MAG: DHH family phosphoesterase [archaeon]
MSKNSHEDLETVIKGLDKAKTLNIFMHDHPDPDTMASALVLEKIANHYSQECKIFYSKQSDFLMNRYTINTLDLPFTRLKTLESPEKTIDPMEYVALVDVASPDMLRHYELLEKKVVIDIDHHPNGNHVNSNPSNFVYKKKAGACVSFLIRWMKELGIGLHHDEDKSLIIASYLGIKVDTGGFSKSMENIDEEAKSYLESLITEEDYRTISTIENAPIPLLWLKKLGEVLHEFPSTKSGVSDVCCKGIGVVDDSGIIPYISNFIYNTQIFTTVIIYGLNYNVATGNVYDELSLKASGRSSSNAIKLSDVFSDIFYKLTEVGDKTHEGGGRKTTLAFAGADIPLSEFRELNIEGLQKLYDTWQALIDSRVKTIFKTDKE